ncbi:MAG: bifunctional ADP-heptose synthase, partial [Patescibacteria group bacterium]
LEGTVERISPEAPVPVVLEKKKKYLLGGAGNVAGNISALGGQVSLLGVIGRDVEGKIFEKVCRENQIRLYSVSDSSRPTTQKTRIISDGHQLIRLDKENSTQISNAVEKNLTKKIKSIPSPDLIIFSDYNKGVINQSLVSAVKKTFPNKKIIADLKPIKSDIYKNIYALSPNAKEAEMMSGIKIKDNASASAAARIIARKFLTSVFLTRGESGMTVCDRKNNRVSHLSSKAVSVFDVTGAGDTVMAVLGLILSESSDLVLAGQVSNLAAAYVVSKPGTASISAKELVLKVQNDK